YIFLGIVKGEPICLCFSFHYFTCIETRYILMKALITTSTLFIALLLTHAGRAQVIERYAFKEATTIRLYVSDSTESAAIARFTDFINKTSWTVQTVAKRDEREQAGRSPALAQPTPQKTMQTDLGSLFDVM